MATKRLGRTTKIDIVEVIEILKSKQTENKNIDETTQKNQLYEDATDIIVVEKDTEEVELL